MSCKYCTEYEDLPEHVINNEYIGRVFDTSIQEDCDNTGWHIEVPSGADIGIKFCPYCGRDLLGLSKSRIEIPVDIGDTLWYIDGGYYNASYMRPKEVEVNEITKKKTKSGKTTEWGFIAGSTRYTFSSIGKTIFWTEKECAEAIEKKKKSSRRFT
jgi:hypothetical protein